MKIDGVEVRVVAPQVKKYTWSHDLPQQYMTNTIIRIRTDEGVEGVAGVSNYTSHDFDRYTAETLRHLIPDLIGLDPLRKEEVCSPAAAAGVSAFPCGHGSDRHRPLGPAWQSCGTADLPVIGRRAGSILVVRQHAPTGGCSCLPAIRRRTHRAGFSSNQVSQLV